MVRQSDRADAVFLRSPHPRGDGPPLLRPLAARRPFSPPTWGWSAAAAAYRAAGAVLPTHVGMVRPGPLRLRSGCCSPHPRGDGPHSPILKQITRLFSPPTWGWSENDRTPPERKRVLPTHVGMVRSYRARMSGISRSPHPRGDGPLRALVQVGLVRFSPPTWGWSELKSQGIEMTAVLPTHVGMVRKATPPRGARPRSPHPRGDGPESNQKMQEATQFSPPTWGWSDHERTRGLARIVLPTHVGMVRIGRRKIHAPDSSPHPRGDGPIEYNIEVGDMKFSPPTWGWSELHELASQMQRVLPTHVGMVRRFTQETSQFCRSPHPRGDGPASHAGSVVELEFSPPTWGWSAEHVGIGDR